MITLFTSKSLCEDLNHSKMTNPRLVKYQSASLLIDDLTTTINDYESSSSSSSSASLSSNTSSLTTLSISQEDIFTKFKTELILVKQIPQNTNNKIRKIKKKIK